MPSTILLDIQPSFITYLPELLRKTREYRCGLSQRQLAKRLDVFKTYISRAENGHVIPRFLTLERYAECLDTRGSSLVAAFENPKFKMLKPLGFRRVDKSMVKQIGPVVRKLREEKRVTQRDVATSLTGHWEYCSLISRVESGLVIPGIDFLEKFAFVIDKPLSVVFIEIENAAYPRSK